MVYSGFCGGGDGFVGFCGFLVVVVEVSVVGWWVLRWWWLVEEEEERERVNRNAICFC